MVCFFFVNSNDTLGRNIFNLNGKRDETTLMNSQMAKTFETIN